MQGRLSLRERLVILMVAAILPLFALSFWLALRETRSATELAQSQLKFAASLVAANQDRYVDAAQQLLAAIGNMPHLHIDAPQECERDFKELRARFPAYTNIGLLALDGSVICHANGGKGVTAADRAYFKDA